MTAIILCKEYYAEYSFGILAPKPKVIRMKSSSSSFSHTNIQLPAKNNTCKDWTKPYPLEYMLKTPSKKVDTYDALVRDIAQLQHHNRQINLFFRAQSKDYLDDDSLSAILSGILRKSAAEPKLLLKQRFEDFRDSVKKLRNAFNLQDKKFTGTHLLNKYEKVGWTLLQHYQLCSTAVIDITQSLHIGSSFAYEINKGNSGIVDVLGLDRLTDAISYSTYQELFNLRLLNIYPPQAQRPFFQASYLLGNFPNYRLDEPARVKQFDLARRIVAKCEIPINEGFWGTDFKRSPTSKMYPEKDTVRKLCQSVKRE